VEEVKYFKDKDFGSKPNEDDIIRNGSKIARVIVALILFHMVYIIFCVMSISLAKGFTAFEHPFNETVEFFRNVWFIGLYVLGLLSITSSALFIKKEQIREPMMLIFILFTSLLAFFGSDFILSSSYTVDRDRETVTFHHNRAAEFLFGKENIERTACEAYPNAVYKTEDRQCVQKIRYFMAQQMVHYSKSEIVDRVIDNHTVSGTVFTVDSEMTDSFKQVIQEKYPKAQFEDGAVFLPGYRIQDETVSPRHTFTRGVFTLREFDGAVESSAVKNFGFEDDQYLMYVQPKTYERPFVWGKDESTGELMLAPIPWGKTHEFGRAVGSRSQSSYTGYRLVEGREIFVSDTRFNPEVLPVDGTYWKPLGISDMGTALYAQPVHKVSQ
jgi:hypothetical protein